MRRLVAPFLIALSGSASAADQQLKVIVDNEAEKVMMALPVRVLDNQQPGRAHGKVALTPLSIEIKLTGQSEIGIVFFDCRTPGAFWNSPRENPVELPPKEWFATPPEIADDPTSPLHIAWKLACKGLK